MSKVDIINTKGEKIKDIKIDLNKITKSVIILTSRGDKPILRMKC